MGRKLLGMVLIGALLLMAAGCIQVSVDTTVGADGTVESYHVEMVMNDSVHSMQESQAQQAGYDSVGEYFLAENASVDQSNAAFVDISEESDGENVTVTIEMQNYDPGPESNLSVREEDGMLVFEDRTFGGEAQEVTPTDEGMNIDMGGAAGSIEYRLEMPGTIRDTSGGAEVTDNVATWDVDGDELYVYAESEVPEDQGGGGDGDESSGLGPGFGAAGAAVAFLLVTLAAARRRHA